MFEYQWKSKKFKCIFIVYYLRAHKYTEKRVHSIVKDNKIFKENIMSISSITYLSTQYPSKHFIVYISWYNAHFESSMEEYGNSRWRNS